MAMRSAGCQPEPCEAVAVIVTAACDGDTEVADADTADAGESASRAEAEATRKSCAALTCRRPAPRSNALFRPNGGGESEKKR